MSVGTAAKREVIREVIRGHQRSSEFSRGQQR
jgi:hypothetical protein